MELFLEEEDFLIEGCVGTEFGGFNTVSESSEESFVALPC